MIRHVSEREFQQMQKTVRSGVVGTRDKVGRAIRPLEAAIKPAKRTILAEHCGALSKALGEPAGSNPASSPYKSTWEAQYAYKLEMEKRANNICNYWYEPFSLWLPGKIRYKPDFLVQYYPTGHTPNRPGFVTTLEFIEVKGWSNNRRDGMTRLKMAAALFPCFIWRLVYRTQHGGWDGEYV